MADIERDVEKLKAGCPVQYVLGETEFYGLLFKVSPEVLIPRPETEELVQMVIERYKGRNVRIWEVFATDVSEEALAVALGNAHRNGVEVTFACHDMRDTEHPPFEGERFDVLVSNPPYIPASDRATMHLNVTEYEPSLALFVPDEDKLWCYEAIARLGQRVLNPEGAIIAETYHDYHEALTSLFKRNGFGKVCYFRDMNGKLRFIHIGLF